MEYTHRYTSHCECVCVLSAPTIKKNKDPYDVRQMCCFNLKRIVKCAKCVMKTIRIHNLRLCTSNVLLQRQSYPVGYYAEAIAKPVREKTRKHRRYATDKSANGCGKIRRGRETGKWNEEKINKNQNNIPKWNVAVRKVNFGAKTHRVYTKPQNCIATKLIYS